jgi:hypothetical protein
MPQVYHSYGLSSATTYGHKLRAISYSKEGLIPGEIAQHVRG